jgi:hypothetical protein
MLFPERRGRVQSACRNASASRQFGRLDPLPTAILWINGFDVVNRRKFDRDPQLQAPGIPSQTIWSFDANVEPMPSRQRRLAHTLLRRDKTLTALLRLRSATDILASAQHTKRAVDAPAIRLLRSTRSHRALFSFGPTITDCVNIYSFH